MSLVNVLVVEHDNGVPGQRGFSEDLFNTFADIPGIVKSYKDSGCVVYHFYATRMWMD